jgi:hypothetical protein
VSLGIASSAGGTEPVRWLVSTDLRAERHCNRI